MNPACDRKTAFFTRLVAFPSEDRRIRSWLSKHPKRLARRNVPYEPSAPVLSRFPSRRDASICLAQAETCSPPSDLSLPKLRGAEERSRPERPKPP